jgi:hypothetical protein
MVNKMIDPFTISIVTILGKYALDKGLELGKEVGPKALETAREMYTATLEHLRRNPKAEVIADEFEEDPEAAESLMQKKVDEALQADETLAKRLKTLLAEYDEKVQAYAASGTNYTATVKGGGAVAQGAGATAVGERGVHITGNVSGNITTGDSNAIDSNAARNPSNAPFSTLSPLEENLRRLISEHFNIEELKNLCQDMNITYENLSGEGREGKTRELIDYCRRHGRTDTLIAECKRRRPGLSW